MKRNRTLVISALLASLGPLVGNGLWAGPGTDGEKILADARNGLPAIAYVGLTLERSARKCSRVPSTQSMFGRVVSANEADPVNAAGLSVRDKPVPFVQGRDCARSGCIVRCELCLVCLVVEFYVKHGLLPRGIVHFDC